MATFSKRSSVNLTTCNPDLQAIAKNAITRINFVVIEGYRGKVAQDEAFAAGTSLLKYPAGYHNVWPSLAFDFIPFPFDWSEKSWNDIAPFKAIADILIEEAEKLGIVGVWGGNWERLVDGDHFQIVSKNGLLYPKTYKES